MRILIVGGGIAGLSLARALERRGMTSDLVERRAVQSASGAGLYLPGNATRAIDQLGLLAELTAKAVPIERQRFLDANGKELSSIATGDVFEPCGPCLSLPRNALHEILQKSLQRTSVRPSQSVADIRQSGQGCDVTFEDGSVGAYDLVVGADGINSTVRSIVFPNEAAQYGGNVCWRFITRNTAGIECWTVMLGGNRALLAIPVSPSDVYVYADMMVESSATAGFSHRSDLTSLFDGFSAPVFPLVADRSPQTEVYFDRIEQVQMPDWVSGRVVVIGDAAHASSPSMAEGAGMAMEDALVLAETLAAQGSIDSALRAFALRRRQRVDWVQKQCAARDKLRTMPGPVRSTILRFFGHALYRRGYTPLLKAI